MLSICFPNAFRTQRIDVEWTKLFPHAFRIILKTFGKHSSCSRSIWGVRKAYGTQHLKILILNAPRTKRMVPRMLPEYFPNIHGCQIRMVEENYFEHAQQIFGATECHFVCIRTEPNSQYASSTLNASRI